MQKQPFPVGVTEVKILRTGGGGGGLKNVDEDISVEIGTGSQILISIIFWPAPEDEILTAQCRET